MTNRFGGSKFGIPPANGVGIDRLCPAPAGLLGQESIRDVILFPQLKPK